MSSFRARLAPKFVALIAFLIFLPIFGATVGDLLDVSSAVASVVFLFIGGVLTGVVGLLRKQRDRKIE